MNWLLPPGASTFAADIDWLYYLILIITGIAFVVVEVGLIWFLIKYRARPGRRAVYVQGSTKEPSVSASSQATPVTFEQ